MRNHPKLIFDPTKYVENVRRMHSLLEGFQMNFFVVSKVYCAFEPMTRALEDLPILGFADSRLENLMRIGKTNHTKLLLRLPDPEEADLVVEIADISLNSELTTLKALNEASKHRKIRHKVILMVEMGDLREGILNEELIPICKEVLKLKHLDLYGIGANFSCYGGIMATSQKLCELIDLGNKVKKATGLKKLVISGGNSSSLYMMEENEMPFGIDHLRLGESLVLGRETAFGKHIEGMHDDVVQLEATLIEVKVKDSYPTGVRGMDAFGEVPEIEDRGVMVRGILAIGKQDVDISGLRPLDDDIIVLGGSSDHLIVALPDYKYKVGHVLRFNLDYSSLLRASTSPFVQKTIV